MELNQRCLLTRRFKLNSVYDASSASQRELDIDVCGSPPSVFQSLEEARGALEVVLDQLMVFFVDLELNDTVYSRAMTGREMQLPFAVWLGAWESAFTSLLYRLQPSLTIMDRQSAMVLKAHHLVGEILAGIDLSLGNGGWDAFSAQFTAIVNLASAVLDGSETMPAPAIEIRFQSNTAPVAAPRAISSFSLGIVDPLYEVCARCKDPALRRRALRLLANHPHRECVWSSYSAWKVGKLLMEMDQDVVQTQSSNLLAVPMDSFTLGAHVDSSQSRRASPSRPDSFGSSIRSTVPRRALNPGLFQP